MPDRHQLRGKALFDGFRGAPPADRAALIDVLLRISALVELVPSSGSSTSTRSSSMPAALSRSMPRVRLRAIER